MSAAPDLMKATIANNATNREALQKMRDRRMAALVVPIQKDNGAGAAGSAAQPTASNVESQDPFYALASQGRSIEPPFDLLVLSTLPEQSSELNQCIEAMMTNIDGTGHRYISRLRLDDLTPGTEADQRTAAEGPSKQKPVEGEIPQLPELTPEQQALLGESRAEKVRLINFFTYATSESFAEFRQRLRRDFETTGNAYIEVLRNAAGDIQGFNHVPSYQMRLGKQDDEARLVGRKILELQIDGSVKAKTINEWKRFRRFVQSRFVHRRTVWYKEFGDDRDMDKVSGQFQGEQTGGVNKDKRATEIIHMRHYSARSPYGLPRYIGNILGIFGDRASEEINYTTFKNNNIPSMAVMVSNGQLTEGTIQRIESFVESQIRSSDNYSKFLIVEAEPIDEEGEDGGQMKVEIKPLTNDQHKDALFQQYSKNNQDKIRRAFRLPPIFVGRSDDYSRSTAEASRRLADEQVFSPERDKFDDIMNRFIFPEMGIRFHKFKSNSPNTTDNQQLVKILAGAEKTGGMTPRIARAMLEQILGIDLPEFPASFPQDVPFSLTMAEAVKNKADASEPGQQVTALKAIAALTGADLPDLDLDDDENVMDIAKKLLAMNQAAERLWQKSIGSEES